MTRGQVRRRMVPSYLATDGCGIPSRNTLQGLTALVATGVPPGTHCLPAHRRIVSLLGKGALTVAETSAHLDLPVGVCKVLAAQLIDDGQLRAQGPGTTSPSGTHSAPATKELLERVVSGLRALKD
ncbi:DUF742 domain-containing protein [Streptomyces acidiscabies]|uniref:DUF742 domain-containing protein n=1 Tax=Streptomyces acidiscabies TaxID=42234 RepID=A0ABU4MCI7_9ACTN|nr:DUF742 domain-containing protein [Streptomyces acidiscabies]MDX3024944.1 DUF742 domain-containing protein [Streptomyces acidiscabies]